MLRVKRTLKNIKECACAESYYPELTLKSREDKIEDNRKWAKKYGEANQFYTLYGLDVVGSVEDGFLDYYSFKTTRDIVNRVGMADSQICLLRDKLLFYKYMKYNNFNVPDVFAIISNFKLYDLQFNEIPFEYLVKKKDYFIKSVDGECASFVKHIKTYNDIEKIIQELLKCKDNNTYILQERVIQSIEMDELNPYALNTYRIVTINKENEPYLLTSLLRVGTKKTGNVDNWAAGGLAIGIGQNGYLKKYGFFKPAFGQKIDKHPDTGIVFNEFKAPLYQEAVKAAINAHKFFYGVRAIGWDIAIGTNGPIFIEGNDNWEISLNQACDRPLRKDWEEVIK